MKKLTIEEYEELGEKVKEAYSEAMDLLITMSEHFPKTVYRKCFDKILRGFACLKDDLDERLFAEHRNINDTHRLTEVFYGLPRNEKGRKGIDANHGRNKMEGELMEKIDA